MLFWFIMLAMVLLIPLIMIGFGRAFMKKEPNDINELFGYRTTRSMKNKDTWAFAHKYCGRIWFVGGLVLAAVTVIAMLFVIGKSKDITGTLGMIINGVQLVVLIGSIIPTEMALKRTFDDDGNRR